MPVVAVIGHEDSEFEPAPTTGRVDGKYVPYGYAGTIVDDCTVLCAGCATDDELANGPMIAGNDESDYPGLWCQGCERPLDTHLLVYESGPGSHLVDDLDDVYMLGGGDS
jgi:hypothetical protein